MSKIAMKYCIVFCFCACMVYTLPTDIYKSEWEKFKNSFGKQYLTEAEESYRFKTFSENLKKIIEHNKKFQSGSSTYKMGVNQFTDLTEDEMKKYMGLLVPNDIMMTLNAEMNQADCKPAWQKFKEEFERIYSASEEEMRFNIFCKNFKLVEEHNEEYEKGLTTYKMAINKFSDMTVEEIKKLMGFRNDNYGVFLSQSYNTESDSCEKQYQVFKKEFNKSYQTQDEENKHFRIFCDNAEIVRKHNEDYEKGLTTFSMELNKFSDMTPEELRPYFGFLHGSTNTAEELLAAPENLECQKKYEDFKKSFDKVYLSEEEETIHLNIFCKNLKMIEEHNDQYKKGLTTFEMGVNRFTDMTPDEIKRYLGVLPNNNFSRHLSDYQAEWHQFKQTFKKSYALEEEDHRFKIFCDNLDEINQHNSDYEKGLTTYKMAVNKFADLTKEEFRKLLEEGIL